MKGAYFSKKIKENGSLIANFETPKHASLETNSVYKASNHYFSAGNGVLKNARFWGETLIGRKLCPLFSHSLEREKHKLLLFCCFSCCCCFVVVVLVVIVVVVVVIVIVVVVAIIVEVLIVEVVLL